MISQSPIKADPDRSSLVSLDHHFAHLMTQLSQQYDATIYWSAALVSRQTREGHVCLDLGDLQREAFLAEVLGEGWREAGLHNYDVPRKLRQCSVVGEPGDFKPLILDAADRLYLQRYWTYQTELAEAIIKRVKMTPTLGSEDLPAQIDRHFPPLTGAQTDWQRVAAIAALLNGFSVITGGPGTGKTHTAAKILALIIENAVGNRPLKIALTAPTGKAAVRLQESVRAAKQALATRDEVRHMIPEEATTIHRLLGYISGSPYFRHHSGNLLEHDVIVVDEASMIDLALMAKLMKATGPKAKMILLGDSNQLASVEAGAVLGDICAHAAVRPHSQAFAAKLRNLGSVEVAADSEALNKPGIRDAIVVLRKSYRFGESSGIGSLAAAVNQGSAEEALAILMDPDFPDVRWRDLHEDDVNKIIGGAPTETAPELDPKSLLAKFGQSRILCAVREGPQGAAAVNRAFEQSIKQKRRVSQNERWYSGQPILVAQNDYHLGLFNGDLGIVAPDERGELKAYFPGHQGSLRAFSPFRLPDHLTAYAMTVHKSQGSEFEVVHLLLPQRDNPILTRELIYTAVTRATGRVEIWGDQVIFAAAVARRIERSSGLRDALWA